MNIEAAKVFFDGTTGLLYGSSVIHRETRLKSLSGLFIDTEAFNGMNPETLVYEVAMYQPVGEIEGGLLFGVSSIHPGKVGNEFFMTKGHFHAIRNRAEYYRGIIGRGVLLLMEENGATRLEEVTAGSLHYIPGNVAHRLINTGSSELKVGACWPSDSGHDYSSVLSGEFAVRVMCKPGSSVIGAIEDLIIDRR